MMPSALKRLLLSAMAFALLFAVALVYYFVWAYVASRPFYPLETSQFGYLSPQAAPGIEVVSRAPLDLPAGGGGGKYIRPVFIPGFDIPKDFALAGPGYILRITHHTQWDFARWSLKKNIFSFEATGEDGEPLRVDNFPANRCAWAFIDPGFVAGPGPGALVLHIDGLGLRGNCAGDGGLFLRLSSPSGETVSSMAIPFRRAWGRFYRHGGDLRERSLGSSPSPRW